MKLLEKIEPKSEGQRKLVEALTNESYQIVGIFGPTGSGKSLFSLAYGLDAVSDGRYRRLIIVKPMIDVTTGREVTMVEAGPEFIELAKHYMRDVLGTYLDMNYINGLISEGKLIFADSHFLKGRTFDESIVFIDDAQTLRVESLIETIVRVGRKSRLIVAADPIFQSLRMGGRDPSSILRDILAGESKAVVVDLGIKDIVREGAKLGLRLIIEYMLRARKMKESELKAYEAARLKAPDADVITVVDLSEFIRKHSISSEHVPKYLFIVKHGHLGRLVGRGGERVAAIEKELGGRVRGVELELDLTNLIRAVHPVSWVWKRVEDVDFRGSHLAVTIDENAFGPFVGQRGLYVRFLESVVKELFNIGIRVVPVESKRRGRGRRR